MPFCSLKLLDPFIFENKMQEDKRPTKKAALENKWQPKSWRSFPIKQQPNWPNLKDVDNVISEGLILIVLILYLEITFSCSQFLTTTC